MNRTLPMTIAAILMLLSSAFGVLVSVLLVLTSRSDDTLTLQPVAPPYPVLVLGIVINGIGMIAAYGVWKNQRWGKILTLILSALSIFLSLPGIFFANAPSLWLAAVIGTGIAIIIIILLLWRAPKRATA